MVHVSGKIDGILGALNLETSFIHHTVLCHILNKFDVIRHPTFALGPNCTATSHKGNMLEMVQMMPPSCFQVYSTCICSLHSVVTTLKKGFTLQKSNMKMTSWKITIFSKETHLQMVDVPLSCLYLLSTSKSHQLERMQLIH